MSLNDILDNFLSIFVFTTVEYYLLFL